MKSGAQKRKLKRDRIIKEVASRPGQLKISGLFLKSIELTCQQKPSSASNVLTSSTVVDSHDEGCMEIEGAISFILSNIKMLILFLQKVQHNETVVNSDVSTTNCAIDNHFGALEPIDHQEHNIIDTLIDPEGTAFVKNTLCHQFNIFVFFS